MDDQNKNYERPEVYALHQDSGNWQISRRDFLKAAGIGAAALSTGLSSRFVRPASAAESLETLCKNSLAHSDPITHLLLSADGDYLVSRDSKGRVKCWNFRNYALTGSTISVYSGDPPILAGYVDGESAVLSAELHWYGVPITNSSSINTITTSQRGLDLAAFDASGNIYAIKSGNDIHRLKKADKYSQDEILCTMDQSVKSLQYLDGSRKLFIQLAKGFAVLDPETKKMRTFDTSCPVYAVAPGDARVLVCSESQYKLVSMTDGKARWEKTASELNSTQPNLSGAAVTPDGSVGILCGGSSKRHLWLISMADGSLLKEAEAGEMSSENSSQIALAKDGTKFAVAAGKSILFFSLPDLKVIGCPVDLTQMKDTSKGIEIKEVDSVTGQTITYTLPCGAPIPEGAVCVCNCVAGEVCSCVGHKVCTCDTVCSCVGNTVCTCDTVCTCNSEGHYWHPN